MTIPQVYLYELEELAWLLAIATNSLESLQQQITFLAGVALQTRGFLDLITAEHGGLGIVLGEECCLYVK